MSYGLLWIELLIACLLWEAFLAARTARVRRKWLARGMEVGSTVIPLLGLGAFVFWAGAMRFIIHLENNWFDYMSSLWLAVAIGAVIIFRIARRRQPGEAPAAATWPRSGIFAAFLAAVALLGMTFWNFDLTIRARANILAIEAQTRWIVQEPALVSDAQNAAPLYEKILTRLAADQPDDLKNPPIGPNDTFDPNEPATISFLNRQAKTIALLRQAAAMPSCRFDDDLETPDIAKMSPELNGFRNAANVLSLDARYELAHGHVGPAMSDVIAIYGLSRHLGQRPLLVSGMVALGIDAMANYQLQETLPFVRREEDLGTLNLLAPALPRRILRRSLAGEECFGLALIGGATNIIVNSQITSGLGMAGMPDNAITRLLFLSNELDVYVDLMRQFQQLLDQPYLQAKSRLDGLLDSTSKGRPQKGIFASILVPSFSRTIQTAAKVEAGDDCAQVALAATRYRLDHGSLPAQLDDLIPNYLDEIPLDPFDAHPLRLVVKNAQWIIYSVGPDGVDNGRVSIDHDPKHQKSDLIFSLKITPPATTQPQ